MRGEPLVINDAREHELVSENLAIPDLKVIAYLGVPIVTAKGEVVGSFCVLEDRPRIWTQDELDLLSQIALQVVEEFEDHRRNRLAKEKRQLEIVHAKKMEAIGTLAGSIAHDFNNILTVFQTYSELICLESTEESTQKFASELLKSSEQAKSVVERLVAWNRESPEAATRLNLTKEVKASLPLVSALVSGNVEVELMVPDFDCHVVANSGQISQVIINLCANAEYAMRETGGGILRISLSQLNEKTSDGMECLFVCLEVSDTGVGISKEHLPRVRDPYFTTKESGSGIGLSTVQVIAESLGGRMEIESLVGQGTQIRLMIPQAHSDCGLSSQQAEARNTKPLRILLVDDNQSVLDGVLTQLKLAGHQVESALSGPSAIKVFQAGPFDFDLLITDQLMPGMLGDELARTVREIRPELPIVLLTGYSHRLNHNNAPDFGIDVFCTKPLSRNDLLAAVDQAMAIH
jgi:signal transduction histidine kinase/ActR/RegA family two-component response regulator